MHLLFIASEIEDAYANIRASIEITFHGLPIMSENLIVCDNAPRPEVGFDISHNIVGKA